MNALISRILFICWLLALSTSEAAQPGELGLPPTPSPIEHFRRLLSVSGTEREAVLAEWPEGKRQVLRRKCAEYDKLPSQERERRLKMMELRWYMQPLMNLPPAERNFLQIPSEFREVIEERLHQWDALPSNLREQLLENEFALQYFARLKQARPEQRGIIIQQFNETQRERLKSRLTDWNKLSPRERRRSYEQFNRFFELPREEQQKTLMALSEGERKEMQRTLEAFAKLPKEQREACVNSFQRFTSMNSEERREFLQNAARWQAMSPQERKQWRLLVNNLPPLPESPARPGNSPSHTLGN
jgi:hypothetical protein